jgi:hypothetical protein
MDLVYIDDSKDEELSVFSALSIPEHTWRACFNQIKQYRHHLKSIDGIYVHKELHAWKFVSGRGNISDNIVTKYRRCEIFKETMDVIANLPGIKIFNAVFPIKQDERAFERLLNRINRTAQAENTNALLICDEGKETIYTNLRRRMGIYNPIASRYGVWSNTGNQKKNIPIDNIIEDPFFKKSHQSYLIQLADFCAYALLRRERPVESKSRYGIHEAFSRLDPVLFRKATKLDDEGILRP